MNLEEQKNTIQKLVYEFNDKNMLSDYMISATWFVYNGDVWIIKRSDGKVLGNHLTFEQAVSVINALISYTEEDDE